MASLGTGIVKPNQTLICGGSFWQQEVNVTEPITDPHLCDSSKLSRRSEPMAI